MKKLNRISPCFFIAFVLLWFTAPLLWAQPPKGDDVPRISIAQLKGLLDVGADVVVVDVRSRRAYDAGHLPKAISMPFPDQIQARHQRLAKDKLIVLY